MEDTSLYQYYSSVAEKPVEWLWYPYIPYGKITLLQGDPGEGKSTFALHLAAILTRGEAFPDGAKAIHPQTVIYQCSEDNKEDTIKPRLLQAGANCEKVAFIKEGQYALTLDDARIDQAIEGTGARLVIFDPIQAFIGQGGDMQNAARMRITMQRLAEIAEHHRCAFLLIGHLTKSDGGKSLYRGLGSIDIAAVARSVLLITRDKDYPDLRYMTPIKSSLSYEASSICFVLDQEVGFQWIGRCSGPIGTLESGNSFSKKEKAKAILKILLSSGEMRSKDIMTRMKQFHISERTVRTAGKELGIEAYKHHHAWYQRLPYRGDSNESE